MNESFYKQFLLQIYLNLPKFIFQFSLDIRIVEVPNIVVDKVGLELENGVPVLSVFKNLWVCDEVQPLQVDLGRLVVHKVLSEPLPSPSVRHYPIQA